MADADKRLTDDLTYFTKNVSEYSIILNIVEKSEKAKEKPKEKPKTSATSTTDDENKYDWMLSVGVATIAMVSYAVHAGLLQVTRSATS